MGRFFSILLIAHLPRNIIGMLTITALEQTLAEIKIGSLGTTLG
ncbi:MAG TPA: hypothetical protein PLG19_05135 [Bacteroidales bacterium]|jgi:hypothetical protein|nr:hypothetical protein [Bacteroidales bacterium]HOF80962.1 hypothetical protein [Bacteroidales bacterium]HPA13060.1 hypothetical protein [Bacteroidales bacterium]